MINIAPQLAFSGQCREAFEYYAALLGGEITVMNSFGDNEEHDLPPGSVASEADHIRFAELRFDGGILRGNDVPEADFQPMQGFNISLHVSDAEKAQWIFDALATGGKIVTEPSKVDWSVFFAMVEDRFGVPWLILTVSEG